MVARSAGLLNVNIENQKAFQQTLSKAMSEIGDLKEAFALISRDFYKSEKIVFKNGPGYFPDLSPRYERQKIKEVGFDYPILRKHGDLEKSITGKSHKWSINKISRKFAIIGSSAPYANIHNEGGRNMPQRQFIFIGAESRDFDAADQRNKGGRLTRWTAIIEKTVDSKLGRLGLN